MTGGNNSTERDGLRAFLRTEAPRDTEDGESNFVAPPGLWLTRAEAAQYVGVNSESTIRAAEETRGLHALIDAEGRHWYKPEALDACPWRRKGPARQDKDRVLRAAVTARRRGMRERGYKDEQRTQAENEAADRQFAAERELRKAVRQKVRDMTETFKTDHMDEREAGKALGFPILEASSRIRDLADRGLLRPIESPCEPRVKVSEDGIATEVESRTPLVYGGPFYRYSDVMALRNDVSLAVEKKFREAPPPVQVAMQKESEEDLVAMALRFLIDKMT